MHKLIWCCLVGATLWQQVTHVSCSLPLGDIENEIGEIFILAEKFLEAQEDMLSQMSGSGGGSLTSSFHSLQFFLGSDSYAHGLSLSAAIQFRTLMLIKEKFNLTKDGMEDLMDKMKSMLKPSAYVLTEDKPLPIPDHDVCPFPYRFDCDISKKYRSYDGSCNNPGHGMWGRAMVPLKRYVKADYSDGIEKVRKSKSGNDLPSARLVSRKIFEKNSKLSPVHTVMMMSFAQFTDHDLSRTALTRLLDAAGDVVDVDCGHTGCETEGPMNRPCNPIELDHEADDAFREKPCLEFTHTMPVLNLECTPSGRNQLNQITSFFDASNVYGSSKEQALGLRDLSDPDRGRLKMTDHPFIPGAKQLMKTHYEPVCRGNDEGDGPIQCFDGGDGRANEQVGLAALHTIWARWHNVVEAQLHELNPHWDGETLYQEARRVVWASFQVIVFREFLPSLIGPQHMKRNYLELREKHYCEEFLPRIDSSISNVFATAAYRFGHSLIPDNVPLCDKTFTNCTSEPLPNVFENPTLLYSTQLPGASGVDSIVFGQISACAEDMDNNMTPMVTLHLFTEDPPHGNSTDLGALNIQRGRDHGLPPYNVWREWCGLSVAQDFDDLTDINKVHLREALKEIYEDVNDIDIFAGGMAERSVEGGLVGPTFACIIARQFRDLKFGDRYWHENNFGNFSFHYGQLAELRKLTLARILCETLDDVDKVQKYVMLKPLSEVIANTGMTRNETIALNALYENDDNERRFCSQLPTFDIHHWFDYEYHLSLRP